MSESPQDIDALLAEVNALADEAVAEIVGDEPFPSEAEVAAVGPALSRALPPADPTPPPPLLPRPNGREDTSRILKLGVPVIVQLAETTMPLSEIVNFTTGAIIEFEKSADSDLDLMINNKCIGQGHAVKVGENFGLRVTQIGSVRSRIQAMGKP